MLKLGADLLRFRAVVTSSEQVKEVEVRGWDTATKQALTATKPAATTSVVLPDIDPAKLAKTFGDARYVVHRRPAPHPGRGGRRGRGAGRGGRGHRSPSSRAWRAGTRRCAPARRSRMDGLGSPFDGKYTVTTSRHRLDPTTGYTTSFSVTGVRDRTMLGLASGGGPATTAPPGVVVAVVDDVNDPEKTGRVRLRFPWLDDTYVSGWARTVQAGAGKDRGALVLPEVGDEVLVVFEQGDVRRPYVLGGLYNGVDQPSPQGIPAVDGGKGTVNRRSFVSRRGHRIDLLDEDGKTEGVTVASGDGKVSLKLDATGTKVTVHSDGTVLIEGTQGITVDSASAKLELKGGQISLTATQGVTVDGGGGPVKVTLGLAARPQGWRDGLAVRRPREDQLAGTARKERAMPAAARVGDPTGHPGVIGPPGVPTVLIAGMPAATVGTPHICSFPGVVPHPPTAIVPPGCPTVLIGGMPAARMGDMSACGAPIVMGAPTVMIGG